MPRRFFQVCAGLLCLALTYHLGALSSSAQSGASIEGPELEQHGGGIAASGCVNRVLYVSGVAVAPPVPGASAIIATAVLANSSLPYGVVLANGDMYLYHDPGGWARSGNMLGELPTNAPNATWGQVKTRYR